MLSKQEKSNLNSLERQNKHKGPMKKRKTNQNQGDALSFSLFLTINEILNMVSVKLCFYFAFKSEITVPRVKEDQGQKAGDPKQ